MKFIKYAVGLVIALSVIPLVVITVNNLDQPKLRTVEFEVVDIDDSTITFSENTYNNIYTLAILEVDDNDDTIMVAINLITTKLNDVELTDSTLAYINNEVYNFWENVEGSYDWDELNELNQALATTYEPTIGDKWEMTFDVSKPLPTLIKTLVGFAPLLFIGGVLVFMLNKRKFD